MKKIIMFLVIAVTMFMSPVFAGNPSQSGQSSQSGQATQVGHHCHHAHHARHGCIFKTIKRHVKKACKKVKKSYKRTKMCVKKCGHKSYDAVQNKIKDAGVCVKKAFTCRKNRTWVKGHYTKNGRHIRGHWRKVGKK